MTATRRTVGSMINNSAWSIQVHRPKKLLTVGIDTIEGHKGRELVSCMPGFNVALEKDLVLLQTIAFTGFANGFRITWRKCILC